MFDPTKTPTPRMFSEAEVAAMASNIKADIARRIIDQLNAHCMCMDCATKAVEVLQEY